MADYDERARDMYVRFKETQHTEGEPMDDGLVIVHRDKSRIVAIEIVNLSKLTESV